MLGCLQHTTLYSGGSNSEHSKTKSIRKPNVSKFGFRMVTVQNGGHFEQNGGHFEQNGGHFVRFSNGSDHSKTEPFKMAILS